MKRRVLRAPASRSIPTFGQIAAALAVTSIAPSAYARGPKDAGATAVAIDAGKTETSGCNAESAMDLLASGKLAQADSALATCVDTCAPKMRVTCVNARDSLASRIPHIAIHANAESVMPDAGPLVQNARDGGAEMCPMAARQPPRLTHVTLDGVEVALGASTAVDPGEHLVSFFLEDGSKIDEQVIANEGAALTLMMPPSASGPSDIPLGGVPPPPPHSSGCCGGTHEDYATNQLRALAALAFGIVVAGARRKTRKK